MKRELASVQLAQSPMHLLHRAGQIGDSLFHATTKETDLTPRQLAVLKAVSNTEDPTQTELVPGILLPVFGYFFDFFAAQVLGPTSSDGSERLIHADRREEHGQPLPRPPVRPCLDPARDWRPERSGSLAPATSATTTTTKVLQSGFALHVPPYMKRWTNQTPVHWSCP